MQLESMRSKIIRPRSSTPLIAVLAWGLLAAGMVGCSEDDQPPTAAIVVSPESPVVGTTVQLDGSLSSDPQRRSLSYSWRFISIPANSSAVLNDADLVDPTFLADRAGTYVVELVVSNGFKSSSAATVMIAVSGCGGNAPVVEGVTPDPAQPGVGRTVRFTARVTDIDLDEGCGLVQSFAYVWELTELPTDSQAELNSETLPSPWIVADAPGTYTVVVEVTDSTGLSSEPFEFSIDIVECGGAVPFIQSVEADPDDPDVGEVVALSANVVDTDNDPGCDAEQDLSFLWSFDDTPAESSAEIQRADLADAWFAPDAGGTYVVELVVTDSTGRKSEPASVTVTAGDTTPDVVVTATPATGQVPLTVDLTCDSQTGEPPLEYAWSFGNGSGSNQQNPSYTFTQPGVFNVICAIRDVDGDFDTGAVQVTAQADTVPRVMISANPRVGVVPLAVTFTPVVEGGDGTFTYAWDFGDGSGATSTAERPSHTFTATGNFAVVVAVTDADGDVGRGLIEVGVGDDSTPALAIDADPASGVSPLDVQFTAALAGGNPPLSVSWDFDDGSTSELQNPVHRFTTTGDDTFTVTARVTDADLDFAETTIDVDVDADLQAVTATASADVADPNELAPLLVAFGCQPAGGNPPYGFSWTFGDGNGSSLQSPAHVYANPGTYDATCVATDVDGDSSDPQAVASTVSVTAFEDVAPVVSIAADPQSGVEDLVVDFDASVSGGNGTRSFHWDFGDGTTLNGTGATVGIRTPQNTYVDPGTYIVSLTVSDADGDFGRDTVEISVDPDQTAADMEVVATATPTRGLAPLTVEFEALSTGGNLPVTFAWDIRDVTTSPSGPIVATSALKTFVHTFAPGTYDATVTATDDNGDNVDDTITVVVDADLTPSISSATATPDAANVLGLAPLQVQFNCVAAGGNPPLRARWDYGDGTSANGAQTFHTYAAPGTYTGTCTVTDADGDEVSSPANAVTAVADSTPQVTILSGSLTGAAPHTVNFDSSVSGGNGTAFIYTWDFGSTDINPNPPDLTDPSDPGAFQYLSAGTYQVTLTVADEDGDVGSDTVVVVVGTNSQPQAFIEASVTRGVADLDVDFEAVVAGGDPPFSFEWDFDSTGGIGTVDSTLQFPPTQTFNTTSTVALRVTDADGSTDTATQVITIDANDVPDVTTTADCGFPTPGLCTQGLAPLVVQFECDASGTNDPFTYFWNFGDGGTSTEQNPIHVYQNPGVVNATCQATDSDGQSSVIDTEATQTITVGADTTPVVAIAASPTSGVVPLTVTFHSSVVGGEPDLTYTWDFGDGTATTSDIDLETVSHPYTSSGVFIATLTVADDTNDVGSDSVIITVEPNSTPTVVASANPKSGIAPLAVNFAANAVGGNAPLAFAWNFGNGGSTTDSTAPNPTFVYESPGTFNVLLTVTDADGESASDPVTVTVNPDLLPLVTALSAINGTSTSGRAPLKVDFECQFNDGNTPTRAEWRFGDGSTAAFNNVSGLSTVSHTFTVPGVFVTNCKVVDDDGDSDEDTIQIDIEANQAPENVEASAVGFGPSDQCLEGSAFQLDVAASDPNGDPLTYRWEFTSYPVGPAPELSGSAGPGQPSTLRNPTLFVSTPGDVELVVRVSDGDLFSSDEIRLTVCRDPASLCESGAFGAACLGDWGEPCNDHADCAMGVTNPDLMCDPDTCRIPGVWLVDFNAGGAETGLTWPDAFVDVQDGIDAADNAGGGEIWVAQATYNGTFFIENTSNITLLGGFAGGEVDAALADPGPSGNETFLEGSSRVLDISATQNITIDGFTIQNGTATSGDGGGLLDSDSTNLTIRDAIFAVNDASGRGGGAAVYGTNGLNILNTQFFGNSSSLNGGALYLSEVDDVNIVDSQFELNHTPTSGGAGYFTAVTGLIDGSRFVGNTTFGEFGGALFLESVSLDVINSVFDDNTSIAGSEGGTIYNTSSPFLGLTNVSVRVGAPAGPGEALRTLGTAPVVRNGIFWGCSGCTDMLSGSMDIDYSLIEWPDNPPGCACPSGTTCSGMCTGYFCLSDIECIIVGAGTCDLGTSTCTVLPPCSSDIDCVGLGAGTCDVNTVCTPTGNNIRVSTSPFNGTVDDPLLITGAPAQNSGDNGVCPADDILDQPRNDGACDIGAYEVQP